ncbi:MAG TPA: hypothetical protein VFX65_06565, partial [Candidatus Limnocylindrales bacterium]|nr:hypothetical protein [Candidatus Limnocylindrales bacterium]
ASLVVWDNGLVVGNPGHEGFRAVELTALEAEDLRQTLLAADLTTFSLPNEASTADQVFCRDCAVSIIRTDVSGDTVEVAVWGLDPEMWPGFQTMPANIVRVGALIEELLAAVRSDAAAPWTGKVPTLPISGYPVGG